MLTPYVLLSPGKLVYERIFSMCVDNRSVLPGDVVALLPLLFCPGVVIRRLTSSQDLLNSV